MPSKRSVFLSIDIFMIMKVRAADGGQGGTLLPGPLGPRGLITPHASKAHESHNRGAGGYASPLFQKTIYLYTGCIPQTDMPPPTFEVNARPLRPGGPHKVEQYFP